MSKEWRKSKERKKIYAIESPSIKRWAYVYTIISSSLNYYGVKLYEQRTYPWYEGNLPMLLVTMALVFATVNFVTNSSLFILETAIKGRISKWRMFLVFTPFLFMFINLIRYPLLYSIPILGVFYFLAAGGTEKRKSTV